MTRDEERSLAARLDEKILRFIEAADFDAPPDRSAFETLALEIFAYQFRFNAPYRRFCEMQGKTPKGVRAASEIPAISTDAFKVADLVTFPPAHRVKTFLTSGTTARKRGALHLDTLALYDASLLPNFVRHLLPDGVRLPMLILTPSPEAAPHSSLVYMIERIRQRFGGEGSGYFVEGERLRTRALIDRLTAAVSSGEAVFLLGTAFSFVHLLDALTEGGHDFLLPPGSRLMETGGFKGRSREVAKETLYDGLSRRLGIDPAFIVNEYGMTEMGSQFYDVTLWGRVTGRTLPRYKRPPPWVWTEIIDPETLQPRTDEQVGLLRHIDLTNRGSVIALQTADLGRRVGPGFEIVGRSPAATPRGCSLEAEDLRIDAGG